MSKIILDSSAWIEYLSGTAKGMQVREEISQSIIYTITIIAAEVFVKYIKEKKDVRDAMIAIQTLATLVNVDFNLVQAAAQIYVSHRKVKGKFSLADAHIVATARLLDAKIITCDTDFLGIPEVIVIK